MLTDLSDLIASQDIDIADCKSVCLVLGPYRNLTTLTAAMLFLHPHCQVLNHAGGRIFGNKWVDFLSEYSEERFDRFIRFAIKISGKGYAGFRGGTILYSHAFVREHRMKEAFLGTGLGLTKTQIKCLFWKESLRTSNLIRDKHVDLSSILESDEKLRFLLPIRNPLDCAISNMKTGHVRLFRGLHGGSSTPDVVQAVLDEIHWFASLQKKYPSRFFYFFEHAISRKELVDLALFLGLDPNEAWLSNALSAMVPKSHYHHDAELWEFYRETVGVKFADFPVLADGLLAFSEPQPQVENRRKKPKKEGDLR